MFLCSSVVQDECLTLRRFPRRRIPCIYTLRAEVRNMVSFNRCVQCAVYRYPAHFMFYVLKCGRW